MFLQNPPDAVNNDCNMASFPLIMPCPLEILLELQLAFAGLLLLPFVKPNRPLFALCVMFEQESLQTLLMVHGVYQVLYSFFRWLLKATVGVC
jgi:hypothetical protein